LLIGWRGRNERTNLEGIFPRSYVTILDEKSGPPILSPQPTSYGNLPLEVSQGNSTGTSGRRSKLEEQGKKFGKKMGNAGMQLIAVVFRILLILTNSAIFGAGATIGSNIVNGLF
jgi:LAS seventeen-binding protein 1/2